MYVCANDRNHECARAYRQARTPPTSAHALGSIMQAVPCASVGGSVCLGVCAWLHACGYTFALIGPHTHTHAWRSAVVCMHMRMHDDGTCLHIPVHIHTDAYVWPRRIEQPPSASVPRLTPEFESGAYRVKRRHRRGVPRTDVRVERRRRVESLRSEPHAVHADGYKYVYMHTHVYIHTHTHARANTQTITRTQMCNYDNYSCT